MMRAYRSREFFLGHFHVFCPNMVMRYFVFSSHMCRNWAGWKAVTSYHFVPWMTGSLGWLKHLHEFSMENPFIHSYKMGYNPLKNPWLKILVIFQFFCIPFLYHCDSPGLKSMDFTHGFHGKITHGGFSPWEISKVLPMISPARFSWSAARRRRRRGGWALTGCTGFHSFHSFQIDFFRNVLLDSDKIR